MRTCFFRRPRSAHILSVLIGTILALNVLAAQAADPAAVESVVAAINQARAQTGLAPLAVHPLLGQAAQSHVEDILTNYNYSHWGSDGSWVEQRVARTGYATNPAVSENWVSSTSAEGAMQWWMSDYIHRVNILNPRWVEMGVGASSRGDGGEMIFVTVFSAGGGASGAEAVAPAAVALAAVAQPAAPDPGAAVPAQGMDYAIQPGDTLLAIAIRYGLDWQVLAAANQLGEHTVLQIGQVIRLPGSAPQAGAETAAIPTAAYTVQHEDTLVGIAARFGTTWEDLASLNGLSEHSVLQIGQSIQVPGVPGAAVESTGVGGPVDLYTVQAGDTIVGIAVQHNLDWQSLLRLNGLAEDTLLHLGQEIRLQ